MPVCFCFLWLPAGTVLSHNGKKLSMIPGNRCMFRTRQHPSTNIPVPLPNSDLFNYFFLNIYLLGGGDGENTGKKHIMCAGPRMSVLFHHVRSQDPTGVRKLGSKVFSH